MHYDRATEPRIIADILKALGESADRLPDTPLTGFGAAVGSDYRGELFLVGRAVNGFDGHCLPRALQQEESRTAFLGEICSAFAEESCPMSWVSSSWSGQGYNPATSAFWRTAKRVAFGLDLPDLNPQSWSSRLAWSNLYKIAPFAGGNPNARLQSLQFDLCRTLLDVEIRTLRPQNMVLATGDWANAFLRDNDTFQQWGASRPIHHCGNLLIEGECIGRFVVADHPQGKDETRWVTSVLAALQR
jgi:hypothetical protein